MRGTAPAIGTPVPIASRLPAVLQEDPLLCRFADGLDGVLASVIATLDCLDAYLDPALTPEDFLDWLGGWVGVESETFWPVQRRRAAVAGAVEVYATRGTVAGLRAQLELLTGDRVEVSDSGTSTWSQTPTEGGGADQPWLVVETSTMDDEAMAALDRVVASAKPAHVPHRTQARPLTSG